MHRLEPVPAKTLRRRYLPTKIKPPATIASIPNKTLIVGLPTDRACIIPVIMSQMPSNRNPVLLINLILISLTSGPDSDTKQVALAIKLGTSRTEFKYRWSCDLFELPSSHSVQHQF